VLIEFPDRAAARAWYGSAAYRQIRALRQEAADCAALILDGCEDPPQALAQAG